MNTHTLCQTVSKAHNQTKEALQNLPVAAKVATGSLGALCLLGAIVLLFLKLRKA